MKINKFTCPTWLIPSYIQHRGPLACPYPGSVRRMCYHPAIRIGPMIAGDIVWASDYCCKTSRSEAIDQARDELARTRKNRCWPSHWRRPPGGDRTFLFEMPQNENKIRLRTKKEEWQIKQAALDAVAEAKGTEYAREKNILDILKVKKDINLSFRTRLSKAHLGTELDTGVSRPEEPPEDPETYSPPETCPSPTTQKIAPTPPKLLDKGAKEEYLASLFGEIKSPLASNPEQPAEIDSALTQVKKEG